VKAALTAAAALALPAVGCGDPPARSDTTVSLRGIERSPRAGHARLDTKERRLRRELARRRARAATRPAPPAASTPAAAPPRPPIVPRLIPFPVTRKREMAAYALRHYRIDDYRLRRPKVIVEHYTVSADAASAIATFSADVPDSELHELPATCAHFVIDRDGTIYQLVPLGLMCRHTVGLNSTAIGIAHAGFSDQQIRDIVAHEGRLCPAVGARRRLTPAHAGTTHYGLEHGATSRPSSRAARASSSSHVATTRSGSAMASAVARWTAS